jgi:general stress protein YciG
MPRRKNKRGFAGMSPQRQREIAAAGGKAAHGAGVAHQFDAATAAEAGRKGGRVVARDRAHMAEIGRKGGKRKKRKKATATKESKGG